MTQRPLLFCLLFILPFCSIAQPGMRNDREHGDHDRGRDMGTPKQEPSTLSIFSENGELFYLVLNGVNQNNEPTSRIRVEGLPQFGNDVQIMFADNVTPGIRRKVNVADPLDGKAVNMTLKIERNRRGAFLRFYKCRELEHDFRPEQGEYVMNYGNPRRIAFMDNNIQPGRGDGINPRYDHDRRDATPPPPPPPAVPVGPVAMDDASFNDAIATIKAAAFSETKMSTAKTIFGVNYLNTTQVTTVCNQFPFEDDKLAFIRFIYPRIIDRQNTFKLGNLLKFSDSKEALNQLIRDNQK